MMYGPHLNANLPCLAPFCFFRVLGHLALAYVNSETYPIKQGTDLKKVFCDIDVTLISLCWFSLCEYLLYMWETGHHTCIFFVHVRINFIKKVR